MIYFWGDYYSGVVTIASKFIRS